MTSSSSECLDLHLPFPDPDDEISCPQLTLEGSLALVDTEDEAGVDVDLISSSGCDKTFLFTFRLPRSTGSGTCPVITITGSATATDDEEAAVTVTSVGGGNCAPEFLFTFTIPRGERGSRGSGGSKGDKGDDGDKGDKGDPGDPLSGLTGTWPIVTDVFLDGGMLCVSKQDFSYVSGGLSNVSPAVIACLDICAMCEETSVSSSLPLPSDEMPSSSISIGADISTTVSCGIVPSTLYYTVVNNCSPGIPSELPLNQSGPNWVGGATSDCAPAGWQLTLNCILISDDDGTFYVWTWAITDGGGSYSGSLTITSASPFDAYLQYQPTGSSCCSGELITIHITE